MQTHKSYSVEEAKRLLERFCVYRDRCHQEVEKKLRELRMIPEAQEVILMHLMEHDFLNEERFSKAFARGKFNIKKWGKQKIQNELKFRNISTYNIKVALKEIDADQYEATLKTLAEKKAATIKEKDPFKKRHKLAQFLISKGYESSLVFDLVTLY